MVMQRSGFMIYGAYGYTGELIAREAVRRGHRPVLAGRNGPALERLATELGLPSVVVALEERAALERALGGVGAVLHAAGPFVHTSAPLLEACLGAGTSYVDITGEIPVFAAVFARQREAEQRGIALLPGVGFDVVPSDCLARWVADAVPHARVLKVAFAVLGRPSAGTAKASFEGLLRGNFVRREGVLAEVPWGHDVREVEFADRARTVMAIPWGDLETAFRSTAIPDITTYMAVPALAARGLALSTPLASRALPWIARRLEGSKVRGAVLELIERRLPNPDAAARERGRAQFWARAEAPDGRAREAWLETCDGYAFTAHSAVLALERLAERRLTGALTPALAFGTDFVLEVPGSVRHEQLPRALR